jgi:hypothetical protein
MNKAYYKSTVEMATKLDARWLETQVAKQCKADLIEKEYDADSLYVTANSLIGFAIKGHDQPVRRGFKSENIDGDTPEIKYTVYKPVGSFKEGKKFKKLAKEYYRICMDCPSFSDWIVKKYDTHRMLTGKHRGSRSGMALYNSCAWIAKGMVIMIIPFTVDSPVPEHVEDFEKIKKSEFIAITEE